MVCSAVTRAQLDHTQKVYVFNCGKRGIVMQGQEDVLLLAKDLH